MHVSVAVCVPADEETRGGGRDRGLPHLSDILPGKKGSRRKKRFIKAITQTGTAGADRVASCS